MEGDVREEVRSWVMCSDRKKGKRLAKLNMTRNQNSTSLMVIAVESSVLKIHP